MRNLPLNKIFFLLISLVSFFLVPAYGKSGASFLKIPIGARAISMGNAYTAMAQDFTALYWNPAGLNGIKDKQLGWMHGELPNQTRVEYLGLVIPIVQKSQRNDLALNQTKLNSNSRLPSSKLSIGMGMTYLYHDGIEGRDEQRNLTGSFSANDLAFTIAGSVQISKRSSFGSAIKILRQSIATDSTFGWAMDFGILTRTPKLNLGMSLLSLGPAIRFLEEPIPLPLTLSLGASYRFHQRLNSSFDFKHLLPEKKSSFGTGVEFLLNELFSLRAGYLTSLANLKTTNGNQNLMEQMTGFNTGFGLKFQKFQLDYAFTPMGTLGQDHRFSIIYSFK